MLHSLNPFQRTETSCYLPQKREEKLREGNRRYLNLTSVSWRGECRAMSAKGWTHKLISRGGGKERKGGQNVQCSTFRYWFTHWLFPPIQSLNSRSSFCIGWLFRSFLITNFLILWSFFDFKFQFLYRPIVLGSLKHIVSLYWRQITFLGRFYPFTKIFFILNRLYHFAQNLCIGVVLIDIFSCIVAHLLFQAKQYTEPEFTNV